MMGWNGDCVGMVGCGLSYMTLSWNTNAEMQY
jgi:hypothetical protein